MTLRDDLIAAKALIADPAKWCKGIDRTGNSNCVMWALSAVIPLSGPWLEASNALKQALPRGQRPFGVHLIVAFNDAPETTHADVMALFDRAIARAS